MEKLTYDNQSRPLKLGDSFYKNSSVAFHSIRYDFKPASVDTSRVSAVEVGENNSVTVTVPHVQGAGTPHTVYKGNKRPCSKECVLVIDHVTGEITLEKLSHTVTLKKTRFEGGSRASCAPVEQQQQQPRASPPKKKSPASSSSAPSAPSTLASGPLFSSSASPKLDDSSSSGSSGDSSSDEAEPAAPARTATVQPRTTTVQPGTETARQRPTFHSTLSEDLRLSESSSDSD